MISYKKHTSDVYQFGRIGNCQHSIFTITDLHENCGMLAVESDYGNWSYTWGSMGGTIREFLIRIGPDYFMDKMTYNSRDHRDVFFFDKTINRLKNDIITGRKDGNIDSGLARKIFDAIKYIDKNCSNSADEFFRMVMDIEVFAEYWPDLDIPMVYGYSHQIKAFVKEVWPVFVDVLKQEQTK